MQAVQSLDMRLIYKPEDLIAMQLVEGIMIIPYDAQRYFELGEHDALLLSVLADDSIKYCLPNMDFSTKESVKKFLSILPFRIGSELSKSTAQRTAGKKDTGTAAYRLA